MKTIELTQGKVALVDDEDYEWLMQWRWHAIKSKNTYYAERGIRTGPRKENKKIIIKLHRQIMKTPDNMEVDHIDHNGLNCQKSNLRNCTHKQNSQNRAPFGSSKYLGVKINGEGKYKGRITVSIRINGKNTHLAVCKTEEEAAAIYDKNAKEQYGEFANLNFK